jgi:hypothetical protein
LRCIVFVSVENKCKSSKNLSKEKIHFTKQPTPIPAAPLVKRLRNNAKVRVMIEPKNKPNNKFLEKIGMSCRNECLEINVDTAKLIPKNNTQNKVYFCHLLNNKSSKIKNL